MKTLKEFLKEGVVVGFPFKNKLRVQNNNTSVEAPSHNPQIHVGKNTLTTSYHGKHGTTVVSHNGAFMTHRIAEHHDNSNVEGFDPKESDREFHSNLTHYLNTNNTGSHPLKKVSSISMGNEDGRHLKTFEAYGNRLGVPIKKGEYEHTIQIPNNSD